MRQQEQEEFNKLPIHWAFGDKQFREAMEKLGLTENDTDKLYAFPGGGFYLRTDAPVIRAWMERRKENPIRKRMLEDEDFAADAFYYEMRNHEYGINWQGNYDVFSCFFPVDYMDGDDNRAYFAQITRKYGEGKSALIAKAFLKAKAKHDHDAYENDWY
jgi:hypothetical protein